MGARERENTRPDILVIDDDPWIVELVVMSAEERGWNVVTAPNGPSGLDLLEREHPRLVLLDVRLPQQDGWEVLAEIERRHAEHPPVIMMTASRLEEADDAPPGTVEMLPKPFSVIPFLNLLAKYLD